jgi:hypothetical protein
VVAERVALVVAERVALVVAERVAILLADRVAIVLANWLVSPPAKLLAGLLAKLNRSRRLGSFCQKSILAADRSCSQRFAERACGATAGGCAGIWVRSANLRI